MIETHADLCSVHAVIKGWDESVIDMSIGEVGKIHCTPDYAYGAGGFPAWGIMPNVSTLKAFWLKLSQCLYSQYDACAFDLA
jgi:FKBP-type peptidyl-prolyl cis-trans isomerase